MWILDNSILIEIEIVIELNKITFLFKIIGISLWVVMMSLKFLIEVIMNQVWMDLYDHLTRWILIKLLIKSKFMTSFIDSNKIIMNLQLIKSIF